MNRLKLDWALSTTTERNEFVQQYIQQTAFISRPLTSDELETIANYILWGKNEEGLSIDQEGLVELPRKNSTWSTQNVESLDELSESPTFNESAIYSLNSKTPTKKVREVFSRENALKNAPAHLISTYKSLWKEIDKTELTINYYELLHEKRTKEPRAELLNSLTEEERVQCANRAKSLNQFKYLKLRHLLVELRREQYTLKDSFSEQVQLHIPNGYQEENTLIFDADVPVYPLGALNNKPVHQLIFKPFSDLIPQNFSKEDLQLISNFFWSKKSDKLMDSRRIDFSDLETVYQIFLMLEDMEENFNPDDVFSTTQELINTLQFYIKETN